MVRDFGVSRLHTQNPKILNPKPQTQNLTPLTLHSNALQSSFDSFTCAVGAFGFVVLRKLGL